MVQSYHIEWVVSSNPVEAMDGKSKLGFLYEKKYYIEHSISTLEKQILEKKIILTNKETYFNKVLIKNEILKHVIVNIKKKPSSTK